MKLILSTYNIHRSDTNFENYLIFLNKQNIDCVLCIQEDLSSHKPELRANNPTRLSCRSIAAKYGYYLCNNKISQDECCSSIYATNNLRGIITQGNSISHRHSIFNLAVSSSINLLIIGLHAPSQLYPDDNRIYLQQELKKEIESIQTEYAVVMGDFNANPYSESIATIYGLDAKPMVDEKSKLCNPCWMYGIHNINATFIKKVKHGTTKYNIFDQILLTNRLRRNMNYIEVVKTGSQFRGVNVTQNLQSDHHPQ